MPKLVKNDPSFTLLAHLVPEILHSMFSRWRTAAILDLEVKMIPKRHNNHFNNELVMPQLVENDTSFTLLAHLVPDILHSMFSRWRTAAILDLEVKMTLKLYNNHFSGLVIPKLVENDTSFILVAHSVQEILHFMFFKMILAAILNFGL